MFRFLAERNADELPGGGANRRGEGRGCLVDVRNGHRHGGIPRERPLAGQHFVADHPQGIHVGGGGDVFPLGLFRGHVLGGAHHHAGAGERCGGRGLGDTKVGDFHLAILGDEQVAGLDVPVDEAAFVDGGQAVGGLLQNV